MKTNGIIQRDGCTIGWRATSIEVVVQRGTEEMLVGRIFTNRTDSAFAGRLSRTLGVGHDITVTAKTEDECVEKMILRWIELDAEWTRKDIVRRADLAAAKSSS